jgi:hypothetical protein
VAASENASSRLRTALILGASAALLASLAWGGLRALDEDKAPRAQAGPPGAEPDFGLDRILGQVEAVPGHHLALGCAKWAPYSEDNPVERPMVVGMGQSGDGSWATTLRQPVYGWDWSCQCWSEAAEDLIPASTALVFGCRDSGSMSASDLAVLGMLEGDDQPRLLLNVNCYQTYLSEVDGNALRFGAAKHEIGSSNPYPDLPHFEVTWQEGRPIVAEGRGWLFEQVCESYEPRHLGFTSAERRSPEMLDTDIGPLSRLDEVVLGSGLADGAGGTCDQLAAAWHDNVYDESGRRWALHDDIDLPDGQIGLSPTPIADLIGVPPPDGFDDWLYTCLKTAP